MTNYEQYEVDLKKQALLNENYLRVFEQSLQAQKLSQKTIDQHVSNADFYINTFLCYYEVQGVEQGCYQVGAFLGDWFLRKAMWSSPASVRSNAASLKKFYACMLASGEISESAFAELRAEIKEDLKEWVEEAEARTRYEDWK